MKYKIDGNRLTIHYDRTDRPWQDLAGYERILKGDPPFFWTIIHDIQSEEDTLYVPPETVDRQLEELPLVFTFASMRKNLPMHPIQRFLTRKRHNLDIVVDTGDK